MTRQLARRAIVWALTCAVLLSPALAVADVKLGFIDSDRIFENYSKTQEAQASFNREVQELSKTAREMKDQINELQKKLDQQGPMLSDAKRDEQSAEIRRKTSEYELFVQQNWGPGGRISKLNEEFLKPIVDRVHAIVVEIGTQEGYALIFDAADQNIIFGDKQFDLTERVLAALRDEDEGRRTPGRPLTNTSGSGTSQTSPGTTPGTGQQQQTE
ncbi:MAG TPA: OmpH family outer membrane protein [Candidatus Eisenbacteria bacterium]|nr:OmpH family outer membrane protein [Candidatus Eisenbacteria bacterium]